MSLDQDLVRLVREVVKAEMNASRTNVTEIVGRGGDTVISSIKNIYLRPGVNGKAYYGDTEIGSGTSIGGTTVKVSSNDTTPGYLNGKLVASTGIALTENNNGGNETLSISVTGGSYGDVFTNVDNIFTADHQTIRGAGGSEANSPTLLFRNAIWSAADYRMLQLTDGGLLNIGQGDYTSIHMTSPAYFDSSMRPNTSDGIDVGGSSNWWRDVYAQKYFIDDASTYINNVAGDMKFFDVANATGKTLTELASGGNHATLSNLDYASAGHTGFFPLVAGSGNRLTGDLYIKKTIPQIIFEDDTPTTRLQIAWASGTGSYINSPNDNFELAKGGSTKLTIADAAITAAVPLAMGTNKITGLGDPTLAQDAVTKTYLESHAVLNPLASGLNAAGFALSNLGILVSKSDLDLRLQAYTGHNITLEYAGGTRLTIADTAITAAVPLVMGSNKITGLAAATTNGDAIRYEQLIGAYLPLSAGSGSPLTSNLWIDATDPYIELLGDTYGIEIKNNAGDFRVTVAAGKKFQFVVSA